MTNKSTKSKEKIRVRIAPSPTGYAHVGTAYTALFNYAFVRNKDGNFIVRLEDTDIDRNVKGAEEAIYKGLEWLGLKWDEGPNIGGKYGPYRQSERLDIYSSKADELLKKQMAYKEEGALRFRNPGDDISWNDEIRGDINFPGGEIGDFVIIKSNGFPTYNFAVVIDDIMMKITNIIRGEEHISNTPRHLALYKAFGEKAPTYAHLPTLRNKERKKLSKRRDPVDLRIYQEKGYLPEALVNFLCLLGWSHPQEKEIFSLSEFIELFSLDRVRKAGPIFDTDKLDWMNGQYVQNLSDTEFAKRAKKFVPKKADSAFLKKIAPLTKSRIKTLSELENLLGFFFEKPKVDEELFGKDYKKHLMKALEVLKDAGEWKLSKINDTLMKVVDKNNFKTGKFFMDLRIAITGKKVTPPINESIEILGKKETVDRLENIVLKKIVFTNHR